MRPTTALLMTLLLSLAALGCNRDEKKTPPSASAQSPSAQAVSKEVSSTPAKVAEWLDKPLENWNAPGGALLRAPADYVDPGMMERCREQQRPPASPEDRAVVAAGWTLFGPLQTFGSATVVSALAGVDGMCRPTGMQTFVFLNGTFAGTISPNMMDSRTDGAQRYAFLTGEIFVIAQFARYKKEDALCCPSRFASVAYKIKSEPEGPVVVPLQVGFEDAPKHTE